MVSNFFLSKHIPKLKILEDNYQVILEEFKALNGRREKSWTEKEKYDGSWKVFGLVYDGRYLESNCILCPRTMKIIESLGEVTMAGFSRMCAGTEILPHTDEVSPYIERIHLGIEVPEGDCFFQVAEERIRWENGKAFLFDPLVAHNASNKTTQDRVILLLDYLDF